MRKRWLSIQHQDLSRKGENLRTRQVTLCLLKVQQHRELESNVVTELPLDVRFDGINHFLGPATTQGRCKVCKKIQEVCVQNATFVSMESVARLVSKLILVANA